ncbi:ribbon-helix-helix protein, CopG family [Sinorhizobium meliloti]|uniref:ribbon-helix-helix protein, CopG family n=1 Tax=Rhizobium meliloti TaxID=382 RepID=UPI000B499534|nr:ribbon-helix-helix protein, CopG family [Sinorhizobium meliloti]ASP96718.1 ribbon-helix-helix protein, CopG family [Sinorhizobium meliloti]MDW9705633.1 ribbon-helix-helix protein, CopG family [Sinorhizobium meliloti]MDW9935371.1 ribbon-helix-helix protein, CopG family [Sinorhizobium meliloti]MDX0101727.1 ribbon-helix-helix protein, CopG family [Sinorhizobium meliloti]MDX0120518.1 ribbon-helix-helix protein, CopG family [Sinorhizobium meliloti]
MSRKVISFRLSDEELAKLDEACRRLAMNRSEAVVTAISVLLRDYVHEGGTLIQRRPWLLDPLIDVEKPE